ncbi:MAG: sugar phosphate isomerase/epimerase [Lunatimonas sp.]|uniref:sugar phosphate isomerase/epimerase family protein n=1 Tax=Lunatimonas sp. TaxID=2060141 RepID=UPI00263AA1BC|nr:sugar phosphate isomerase/epimerase family protein [Lunatimonas sp.]MCC5936483.1 sugar phosphate isomerase/epimerase [Lunatimonas sp.]
MRKLLDRREFVKKSLASGMAVGLLGGVSMQSLFAQNAALKLGLVTYQWGKDMTLPELIAACEKTGYGAVELRTEHAHGVEVNLSKKERNEVKKRFRDSPVTCLGYGSNYEYHSPDPAVLKRNIEGTKEYIKLCKDIGATGIKVKPNTLPEGVPREKTIAQIASSFNEVGKFAKNHGQLVRVEVHGRITQELPVMKEIFDQVTEKNVVICWNSNDTDLKEPGLEANFNMVKQWIGDTTHCRAFSETDYPFQDLFRLLNGANYQGWILLEAHSNPADKIAAMQKEKQLFDQMVSKL